MHDKTLQKTTAYLLIGLPPLAFLIGLLLGWAAFLNEATAWTLGIMLTLVTPFLAVATAFCLLAGIIAKSFRRYVWVAALAIACFMGGVEVTSGLTRKSMELWYGVFTGNFRNGTRPPDTVTAPVDSGTTPTDSTDGGF